MSGAGADMWVVVVTSLMRMTRKRCHGTGTERFTRIQCLRIPNRTHAEHLDAHEEVQVLIGDLPILPGLNWTRKEWITQQAIFSIETEPETATAVDVNKSAAFGAGGSPILTSLVSLASR